MRIERAIVELHGATNYIDLESGATAANKARAISGRTDIPVIVFTDGSNFF